MDKLDFSKAFSIGNGIDLDGKIGIFWGNTHPAEVDVPSVPVGSVFIRTNGDLYTKVGEMLWQRMKVDVG